MSYTTISEIEAPRLIYTSLGQYWFDETVTFQDNGMQKVSLFTHTAPN